MLKFTHCRLVGFPSLFTGIIQRNFSTHPKSFTIDYLQGLHIIKFQKNQGFDIITRDYSGSLRGLLGVFKDYKVNITSLEPKLMSKKNGGQQDVLFRLAFQKLEKNQYESLLFALQQRYDKVIPVTDEATPEIAWFPRDINDLQFRNLFIYRHIFLIVGRELIRVDEEAGKDSAQFTDQDYRIRREEIGAISRTHKMGEPLPIIDYTEEEHNTWRIIYKKLRQEHKNVMSERFQEHITKMEKDLNFAKGIPQLRDVDAFLYQEAGFRLKAVHGILSQREFLNALGHRIFCSTQYIRSPKNPEYTPEPDIVHELVGHAVMFADKDVADISQEIGILSCGVSDEQIKKLGTIYWFTVEFGACRDSDGVIRGWGAGIGSSIGECQNLYKAKHEKLDPFKHFSMTYPIQQVQPVYLYSDSFQEQLSELIRFGESQPRPFHLYYDFKKQEILCDRKVRAVFKKGDPDYS